ncbi:YSIRK-type signal peptide-containing protein [Limosilactobacillus caccae]|uniref:YSIRK-type signal peptide-containing protein n=1 Tax=Limosilactobacillus caccae TaxID=1926284 RepID=UPI000970FD6D|nr:YSIRK-type signal peptide-containing protein [Limosilactobacillus caccae]
MVSKNNQWNKMQQEADRVPHYGLRKLSVGVASVLLSTTLLFGMASTAHADNAPSNTTAATTSTSSAGDTDVQSEGETPAQHNAPVASGVGDETATTPEMQTFTVPQASSPVSKQALAESKAEKTTNINFLDENSDYKDTVTVETGKDVQVNFQTNDYVDGDKFTFKIHPSSDGIDISNTYNLTPADNQKNKATVSKVSENVNEYEFSDTMKGSGTYNQIIAIKTNGTFDPTVVRKDGTYEIAIDVYKNGQKIKNTTFKQIVHHKPYIYWQNNNGENDSLHNIYTMDHQYVSNGQVLPNVDYQWRLAAGINPIFNQGTTLTVPVPEHFILNEAKTKANSPKWFKDYGHLSIKQDGNKLIITFPKINDDQLKELKLSASQSAENYPVQHDFYIVGKIDQKVADKTTISGADDITIKNESDQDHTVPLKAVLLGTNNTIENTPIGDLLAGNITPDQHNEKLHKYFPDQPEWITTREDSDKGIHALNRNVSISSQANETLNGVDATVIVPDGMNISTIVNNDTSDANPVFQYEYTDGSKSDKFTKDNIPTAPAGKFIKNIHVHSDKVDPFHKMFSIDLMGVLAKQYRGDNNGTAEKTDKSQPAKGDKVSNLDQLITKIALTLPDSKTNPKHDPTSNDSVWYQGQIVLDKNPDTDIHFNQNEAEANQPSKQAGATGGTLTITQLDVQDEVPNLTYHVIIPINAVLNPDNPISNLPKNATVSYFDVNGRTVVKIQIKGGKREDIINKPFTLHLDNAAVINNKTLKSYWDVYVTVPDGQKSYDPFDTDNPSYIYRGYPEDEEDLKTDAFVENNKNSYWAYTSNHEWRLVTATVTQTTTEAVGNLLPSYAAVGKSDDKGSKNMKFSSTIMNADSNDVTHLTTILRMPNTEDGKSEFNFNLQKPVKVINVATGQEVTEGVQIFYTTNKDYKSKKMADISKDDWQNDFTNSLPADPSTVTAVAVKIAKVPTQAFYRVVAEGTDPTLRTDAGKTAYVANKIWSDQLLPKNVEAGKTSTDDDTSLSAKITVFGESHIKVKFRYQKPDGSYEYIDGDDLVLEDNKDILKKEDLFKKILGIDSDTLKKYGLDSKDINKLNDNPEFRKELTNRYPGLSDYAIDFTKPSDPSNQNGGDVAKWGDTSTWYFDGNQVTFDLTKLVNSSPNVTLSRETTFVSSKDDSKLKNR